MVTLLKTEEEKESNDSVGSVPTGNIASCIAVEDISGDLTIHQQKIFCPGKCFIKAISAGIFATGDSRLLSHSFPAPANKIEKNLGFILT